LFNVSHGAAQVATWSRIRPVFSDLVGSKVVESAT
jgi:hypothetical protein